MFSVKAQDEFPADTIFSSTDIGIIKKIAILPMAGWQRLSYRSDFLNCQFEPSCSNYGALAIRDRGIIYGTFLTTDRIMRCNPEAMHYHLNDGKDFLMDGRLLDPVPSPFNKQQTGSRSIISAGLSAVIPGLGRIYNGRIVEGILSGFTVLLMGQIAYSSINAGSAFVPLTTGIFIAFYGGEIVGSFRSSQKDHNSGG